MKQVVRRFIEAFVLPPFLLVLLLGIAPWLALRSLLRGRPTPPRTLYAPTPVITMAKNAAADRAVGNPSDSLVYYTFYITDAFTFNLERYFAFKPLALFMPWFVFLWAVCRYDQFQFFFNGGLLQHTLARRLELPLLRLLGKKTLVSAYGSDVRTESVTRALGPVNCCMDCTQRLTACVCDTSRGERRVAHVRRWADVTLSMGDMTEYTPGSRNDIFYWPIDLAEWPYVGAEPHDGPVRVVHAPNHPQFKGTRFLEAAIAELQAEGRAVELIRISGMSNTEARRHYETADIIADQFVIGWHGYFAVEAMALGKPVLCNIRKPELYLASGHDSPIVNVGPDQLKQTLADLIDDPARRLALGVEGRAYVEAVYAQEVVGARMAAVYRELWEPRRAHRAEPAA